MWLTGAYEGDLEGGLEWHTSDKNLMFVDGGFIKCMQREKWDAERSFAIISVTGKIDDKGTRVPFDVKVGDIVLPSKYGGSEIKFEDQEYKILNSSDILAVIA